MYAFGALHLAHLPSVGSISRPFYLSSGRSIDVTVDLLWHLNFMWESVTIKRKTKLLDRIGRPNVTATHGTGVPDFRTFE